MADNRAKLAAWIGSAAVVTAVAFTSANEGTVLKSYMDPVNVLTACTGETHYVVTPGDIVSGATFTRAECAAALERSMWEHAEPVIRCTKPAVLTTGQKIAFLDATYTFGGQTFCNSSIAAKARIGDVKGSCEALLLYRMAQGRDCSVPGNNCRGLWTRRQREYAVCMETDQ